MSQLVERIVVQFEAEGLEAIRTVVREEVARGNADRLAACAEIARLQAELAKPVAGPWHEHENGWSRCAAFLDGCVGGCAHVGADGWLWCGGNDFAADVTGPETGEEGRRLADAAAVAAGWRLIG